MFSSPHLFQKETTDHPINVSKQSVVTRGNGFVFYVEDRIKADLAPLKITRWRCFGIHPPKEEGKKNLSFIRYNLHAYFCFSHVAR